MNMPHHAFDDAADTTPRAARHGPLPRRDAGRRRLARRGHGAQFVCHRRADPRARRDRGKRRGLPAARQLAPPACWRGAMVARRWHSLRYADQAAASGACHHPWPARRRPHGRAKPRAVAPLRQPGAPARPVDDVRADIVTRIAEEIGFAARTLERLGARLAEDPGVVARHGADLQVVDVTAQALGHLTGCSPATLRKHALPYRHGRLAPPARTRGAAQLRSTCPRSMWEKDAARLAPLGPVDRRWHVPIARDAQADLLTDEDRLADVNVSSASIRKPDLDTSTITTGISVRSDVTRIASWRVVTRGARGEPGKFDMDLQFPLANRYAPPRNWMRQHPKRRT